MSIIRVNYANVERQVVRLLEIAAEHRRASAALDSQRAAIAAAWRDPAGTTYAAAAEVLVADIRSTADDLTRLAHSIRDAAARYRQQEEAAARAARRLQN